MTSVANDLLLHAKIALTPIDAVQEGDRNRDSNIGATVVHHWSIVAEASEASEATKASETLSFRTKNICEMT